MNVVVPIMPELFVFWNKSRFKALSITSFNVVAGPSVFPITD